MSKIYVWITTRYEGGDVAGVAVAEDGATLTGHLSSNENWFMHDMGITGTWKHDQYKAHYPNGYELIYVSMQEIEDSSNKEFEEAYAGWLKLEKVHDDYDESEATHDDR